MTAKTQKTNPNVDTKPDEQYAEGYVPSHEEIRRECARIRESWTEKERRKRAGVRETAWTVPVSRSVVGL